MLKTPGKIRQLQRKLYRKAKQGKEYRFYLLYDKVYRMDILNHAYRLVKANKGASGIDGETFERIEERGGGVEKYLEEIAGELRRREYKPQAVRRGTYPAYVEDEVRGALASDNDFVRGPRELSKRGTRDDDTHAFVIESGHYVSARWPGDAYLIGKKLIERLA